MKSFFVLILVSVGIVNAVVGPQWTWDEGMEEPAGEKDMGGWTSRVYTDEQMERLGVDEFGKKQHEEEEEEMDPDAVGCCFDHGFGSRMVPCCFSNHRMTKKNECSSRHRFGGSSSWDSRHCKAVKIEQGVMEEDDEMGCCYEHGFGAFHKPCCFTNHRPSNREECQSGKRIGGATKFDTRQCEAVMEEQGVEVLPEPTLLQKLLPGILPVNLDMLAAGGNP